MNQPDPAGGSGPLAPQPVWPTAIGVIGLIVGGAGVLLYGCGSVVVLFLVGLIIEFLEQMATAAPDMEITIASLKASEPYTIPTAISYALCFIASVVLLVGAARLIQRRRVAAPILTGWALYRMIIVVPVSIIGYASQKAQNRAGREVAEASTTASTASQAEMMGLNETIMPLAMAFGIAWAWVLPIFILVWFTRKRIKAQVISWGMPDAPVPADPAPPTDPTPPAA